MSENLPKNNEEAGHNQHDISRASTYERRIIFERIALEKDEKWAGEALQIDQPFSPEEIEQLVSMISDPELAVEVLTLDESTGKKLNLEQKEKLMTQIEKDKNVVYLAHLNFMESGIEPTETEKWWLGRFEKILNRL